MLREQVVSLVSNHQAFTFPLCYACCYRAGATSIAAVGPTVYTLLICVSMINYSSPLPFLPFYFTPGDHRPVSRKQRIGLDYRTQMRQKIHQRYNDHIFDITIMIITQEYEQIYKRGHSHQNIEKTVVDNLDKHLAPICRASSTDHKHGSEQRFSLFQEKPECILQGLDNAQNTAHIANPDIARNGHDSRIDKRCDELLDTTFMHRAISI